MCWKAYLRCRVNGNCMIIYICKLIHKGSSVVVRRTTADQERTGKVISEQETVATVGEWKHIVRQLLSYAVFIFSQLS
jgi:hypothetical protein